jgi:putative hydrolase of HD superfamily
MAMDLTPFLDAVLALKTVKRAGWAAKAKIKDAESVADHSYSMCAIGIVLSDMLGLDTKKAMRMIILHDLAESVVGDYMPGQVAAREKTRAEDRAMKSILACLPAGVRSKYQSVWKEFLAGRTEVARFVHRIDKLEMALQADRYAKAGHDGRLLEQFMRSAEKAVNTDDDLLAEILRSLHAVERTRSGHVSQNMHAGRDRP